VNVLTQFHEDDREPRVLTHGNAFAPGDLGVFDEAGQNVLSRGGFFDFHGLSKRLEHVFAQFRIGANREVSNGGYDLVHVHVAHERLLVTDAVCFLDWKKSPETGSKRESTIGRNGKAKAQGSGEGKRMLLGTGRRR
jgi:hypothetical protein